MNTLNIDSCRSISVSTSPDGGPHEAGVHLTYFGHGRWTVQASSACPEEWIFPDIGAVSLFLPQPKPGIGFPP